MPADRETFSQNQAVVFLLHSFVSDTEKQWGTIDSLEDSTDKFNS